MRILALLCVFVFPAAAQTSPPAVPAEIQALLDAHDYPKAELAIQQKLSVSPAWERGHVLLAQMSEEAFRQGLELAPENWELHYFDGRALYELEKFSDSEKAFQRAIERNPRSVKAWTALGQVKDRLGDVASSEQSYQKAVGLCVGASRDCAWPLLELGFLASRQTGEKDAERYFRRAVEARPDWAKPHFYLGKTLAALGQLDAARAQLEDAARIQPDQSQHEYQLAQIYRRLGDPTKSEQHLARYRELAGLEAGRKTPSELNVP